MKKILSTITLSILIFSCKQENKTVKTEEVKKTETLSTELQLNSSHPKAKLFYNSTLINAHCRNCEEWETKDFIYVIGHLPKSNYLSSLWFIHGEIYAADESVYIDLKNSVSELLESSDDLSFSPTNEIGTILS